MVINDYGGKIPQTMEALLTLPGVGRKTANCVLAYAFGIPAIAVDIHVFRIVNETRLNWMSVKNPEKTELKLMEIIPHERWLDVNKLIVDHGQRICAPIRPKCDECTITSYCEFEKKNIQS